MALNFSFGTVATGVAWFGVRVERNERLPAWSSPQVTSRTYVFPGSFPPKSETEIISIGPCQLQWRLYFPTDDAYHTMLAKLGTEDTLTVLARLQSHKGTYREIHGLAYTELPGTLLLGLDADSPDLDGQIEAVATFQRHIDPATGLLVAS